MADESKMLMTWPFTARAGASLLREILFQGFGGKAPIFV